MYKVETFKGIDRIDLQIKLEGFLNQFVVLEIIDFAITTEVKLGITYFIGVLIYK